MPANTRKSHPRKSIRDSHSPWPFNPCFLEKSKGTPKKARVFLFAEPLKSLEKEGKTYQKAREIGKRKKQGNRREQGFEGQGDLLEGPFSSLVLWGAKGPTEPETPKKFKVTKKQPKSGSGVATPLACYRIGFGPPARNRKKIGKISVSASRGAPPENRKTNSRKKGKWPQIPVLSAILFSGAAEAYIFPIFSYFGPEARNLFCSRPTVSQLWGSTPK